MTETNGYVYEAKVECTEFRAALNTQPTPQEKQSWTRAYLLGLGIVLLVVAACIGLLLMYRTESSEFSKSRFCKYLLRGILGMTVLGGTTLCIYASMAILDTKYEAVVVVHESFMQTINSLPTEFKSSEGKAAWWSFFGNFGTHYYDSIVTGGKMQTNTIFDETFVKNRKAFEVKIAAKAAFGGVELGPSYGYTDEDVKTATENSKATKQFQEGGDATTFFTDGWEKWVSTIDEKPAIIDFKVKPLWNLVQDPTRQNLVRAATEEYLDYVGNAQNPGDSCTAIASAMRQKYDIPLNNGIHYVRDLAGKQSMVFCDFSQSVAGGGWTLAVNKLGGFTGNFQPALAWLAATSINKQRPGLSSDYKLDFETFFDEQKGVEVMLQFNADADKGARAYARLSPKKGWEHYTHPDTGSAGARHLISAFGTNANALSSSLGSLPSDTNHYLVLSYDGGICIVPENAAIESSAMGFSCDGDNGLNKGVGLFDATSANEFNNCETFAWKTVYGGEDPEEYWSDTCKAIGGSCNSKCSRGGTCLNSNGCVVHNSNTQGCGFLDMGCKPRCRLIKNSVSKCGTSFAPTDFVSLWFREGGAVHVDATSKEGGGN